MFFTRTCNAKEFFNLPNCKKVIEEYIAVGNTENNLINTSNQTFENYRDNYISIALESEWLFTALLDDGKLIAFSFIYFDFDCHLLTRVAYLDSIFCLKEYRKQGLGQELINITKSNAKSFKASFIYLIAQHGSRLEKIYQRKYKQTDSLFLMEL